MIRSTGESPKPLLPVYGLITVISLKAAKASTLNV
jgi:hypothetical protein